MMMLTTILDYYKIHDIMGRNLEALEADIYKEATGSLFPQGLEILMEKHVIKSSWAYNREISVFSL